MKKNVLNLCRTLAPAALLFSTQLSVAQTGEALSFDGTNDRVTVANSATLNFGTGDFSIEAKIKTSASNPNFAGIVAKDGTAAPIIGWQLVTYTNSIAAEIHSAAGSMGVGSGLVGTSTLNTGAWRHVAMVVSRATNNIKLYVDGQIEANVTNTIVSLMNISNTTSLFIGSERNSTTFFNGNIDEVRLWNVARTQCEINSYMNCEIPTNASGLVANYHFNQGVASGSNVAVTTLTDATANANTGTLQNFALNGATSNWVAPGGVVSGFTTALAGPSYTSSALSVCAGNTVILSGIAGTSYSWTGGVTNGTAFTPSTSIGYTFTGTNSVTTCSNTAVASVTVNPLPAVTAVSSETNVLCDGQSATLTAGGGNTYVWNTTATTAVIVINPSVTTSYTVTGTGANGCQNTATITQSVTNCTGLNAIGKNNESIHVFPNPTSGNFVMKVSVDANIQILDLNGRSIYADKLAKGEYKFDLSQFATGIYIIRVTENDQVSTYKLVKQ